MNYENTAKREQLNCRVLKKISHYIFGCANCWPIFTRDAMLSAVYMPSSCVRQSVCISLSLCVCVCARARASITIRYCIKTAERITVDLEKISPPHAAIAGINKIDDGPPGCLSHLRRSTLVLRYTKNKLCRFDLSPYVYMVNFGPITPETEV